MTNKVTHWEPARVRPQSRRETWGVTTVRKAMTAAAVVLASMWWVAPGSEAHARTFALVASAPEASTRAEALGIVPLSKLPMQGQEVYRRISQGGPFLYSKDGVVFGNRERLLPRKPRGHYREYTVPTPGSRDRGARRIVCGGEIVQSPETCFYTQDHYQSFQKIDPRR
jgi:ribonuclease T1